MTKGIVAAKPRNRAMMPIAGDVSAEASEANDRAASSADRESAKLDVVGASADVMASERDDDAIARERVSGVRDAAATARDLAATELELAHGPGGREYALATRNAAEVRASAASDRELAAADRKQAALDRAQATLDRGRAANDRKHAVMDREHAALDRSQALSELEEAHTDGLTGALRRGAGRAVLQQEVERAQRSGAGLVLAFVDLDGLKDTNDRGGHAAGDARLRQVVDAMRSKMRAYEPIVRNGGDEFLCSFAGVGLSEVESRFSEITRMLDGGANSGSITVGLAELRSEDTLQGLIHRADEALIEARNGIDGRRDRQSMTPAPA